MNVAVPSAPDDKSKQSKGGDARAASLSKKDRQEIARDAALARWGGVMPYATREGALRFGGRVIACAVLNTRKRVLTQETFLTSIGRAAKAKSGKGSTEMQVDDLPPFLAAENLIPFVDDELRKSTTPVLYRTTTGGRAFGYDALLLPMVCEVYLKARDAGALLKSQEHIADACLILTRGLARAGIIALVDDATGYTADRARDELERILDVYISAELRSWTKRFPDEFFRQIYRLHKWDYRPGSAKRTPFIGKLINKYIYEQLPEGVLPALRVRNPVLPSGRRRVRFHQFLSIDTGDDHLDKQIVAVTTLMKVSNSNDEFEKLFARAHPGEQMRLPFLDVDTDPETKTD